MSVIFGELSRRNSLGIDALLTAVWTLIVAMSQEFGTETACWFAVAFIVCIACYIVNIPEFGLATCDGDVSDDDIM
jgi:predicted branched-subunit amino acid permease